jgi:peroxiredoxin
MKFFSTLLLILIVKDISAQSSFEQNFPSMQLQTLDQKNFHLVEIKKNTASVFIFLLPDCPASQSYSLTLNQLSKKFESSGISFYGVFPGNYNTLDEMKEFQHVYKINFDLFVDPEKILVKNLSAKVAPEVFVVNRNGQTVYRGRIDDWMYALGKKKPVIRTHELEDALNAVIHHQPVKISATQAIGCIIE